MDEVGSFLVLYVRRMKIAIQRLEGSRCRPYVEDGTTKNVLNAFRTFRSKKKLLERVATSSYAANFIRRDLLRAATFL